MVPYCRQLKKVVRKYQVRPRRTVSEDSADTPGKLHLDPGAQWVVLAVA
jgi:hypothetical protein